MSNWINNSVLNAKGTPAIYEDILANIPAYNLKGMLFVSTDTKALYRNNGVGFDLIGAAGGGTLTGIGTVGTIPKFTGASVVGDSVITEAAGAISVAGNLTATKFIIPLGTSSQFLKADGSLDNTAYLTGILGTLNRISVTGGNTVDISATYAGQNSIVTVGSLTSGSIPYGLLTGVPSFPTELPTPFLLTMNNSGAGAVSGATFNGATAITLSYNTIGASPLIGSASITTVGTLSSGSIPYALLTGTPTIPTLLPTPFLLTVNRLGLGAASGVTFNGAAPVTISYNTIGALPLTAGSTQLLTGDLYINKLNAAVIFQGNAIDGAITNTTGLLTLSDAATNTKRIQLDLNSGTVSLTNQLIVVSGGARISGTSNNTYIDAINGNTINFNYTSNANDEGYINYHGYLGGITQFRDLKIADGKGVVIVSIIGATKAATFQGTIKSAGTITVEGVGGSNGLNIIGATGNLSYVSFDQSINNASTRWRIGNTGGVASFATFDIYNQTNNIVALTINATGAADFIDKVKATQFYTTTSINPPINSLTGVNIGFDGNLEQGWIQSVRNNNAELRDLYLNKLGGNVFTGARLNVNGASDTSIYSLNTLGCINSNALSFTGSTVAVNQNLDTNTVFVFNGGAGITWTLTDPLSNNRIIYVKNFGSGVLTVAAFGATNIVNNLGALVASVTVAIGATAIFWQDGINKSFQLQ
jgi:hypothetical protein